MSTFWKEIVNFEGESRDIAVALSVFDGVGECEISLNNNIKNGKILLFLKEKMWEINFAGNCGLFPFETLGREYFIKVLDGEKQICDGGNQKELASEKYASEFYVSDTFEGRVATFNYYENEMGENGKDCNKILLSQIESSTQNEREIEEIEPIEVVEEQDVIEVVEEIEPIEVVEEQEVVETVGKEEVVEKIKEDTVEEPKKEQKEKQKKNYKSDKKKKDFFSLVKTDVEKLFKKFPREEFLEDMLENSKWVKVAFAKGVNYAVGLVYADDLVQYIGYGVIGKYKNPPKELEKPQFLPLDLQNPDGDGYYLIFQNAENGEKV